jgi:hypothetical protein
MTTYLAQARTRIEQALATRERQARAAAMEASTDTGAQAPASGVYRHDFAGALTPEMLEAAQAELDARRAQRAAMAEREAAEAAEVAAAQAAALEWLPALASAQGAAHAAYVSAVAAVAQLLREVEAYNGTVKAARAAVPRHTTLRGFVGGSSTYTAVQARTLLLRLNAHAAGVAYGRAHPLAAGYSHAAGRPHAIETDPA